MGLRDLKYERKVDGLLERMELNSSIDLYLDSCAG
jgi:hypothetical protein